MYEPDDNGLRGYPTLATINENAKDEIAGEKFWELAEEITGLIFP